MDPYLESQKRLDRGETVCVIDTSFQHDIPQHMIDEFMAVSITEAREQRRAMNEYLRKREPRDTSNAASNEATP